MQNYFSEIKIIPDSRYNKPILESHEITGDDAYDETMNLFYHRKYAAELAEYEKLAEKYFHFVPYSYVQTTNDAI